MALTPEEMEEVKSELATRMGGQKDPFSAAREGEVGFKKDPFSTAREGELGALGAGAAGGMGFGGINASAQAAPMGDNFNPAPEKLLVDPAGMDAGASARGGFSNAMGLANALRKKGGSGGEIESKE